MNFILNMDKEERLRTIQWVDELRTQGNDLTAAADRLTDELKREVVGRNECIHLGQDMPTHFNRFIPVCMIDVGGSKYSGDNHCRVESGDCASCSEYIKNPRVKKSIFTGVVYKH